MVNGTNVGATVQSNEPLPPFTTNGNAQTGWCGGDYGLNNTVWYSFVAPASGSIDLNFTNSTDMGAALYGGIDPCAASPFANAELIAANEDAGAGDAPHPQNAKCLTPGQTYYVMVDGYNNGNEGTFTITVTDPQIVCPVNNDCVDAIDISDLNSYSFDTSNADATTGIGSDCNGNADDDIWYVLTTDDAGTDLTVTVTGGAEFALFSGSCGSLSQVGICNQTDYNSDDGIASTTTYYVRVYDPAAGFTGGAQERAITNGTIQAGGSALPAELTTFTGAAMDKYNALKWETAAEYNTAEFAVERSLDGRTGWTVIGTVAAAGYSDTAIGYGLEDTAPAAQSYYRLRTTDLDGSTQISSIIDVKRAGGNFGVISVSPNPARTQTTVTFESAEAAAIQTVLTDITGKIVSMTGRNAVRGVNTIDVDLTEVPSGVYFLTLNNGVSNITRRIVKN